jgi:hypothetical protein
VPATQPALGAALALALLLLLLLLLWLRVVVLWPRARLAPLLLLHHLLHVLRQLWRCCCGKADRLCHPQPLLLPRHASLHHVLLLGGHPPAPKAPLH